MKIELKTLTPIWTGDTKRECKEIRETGILGSLRWWWEAILRGIGADVCDPMEPSCQGNNHCAACHLFGCTGWGKLFRLRISNPEVAVAGTRSFPLVNSRGNRWELKAGMRTRQNQWLTLSILPLKREEFRKADLCLKLLLTLQHRWAGMGANTQHGFGTIALLPDSLLTEDEREEAFKCLMELKDRWKIFNPDRDGFPNLTEMFFCRIRLDGSNVQSKKDLASDISDTFEGKEKDALNYSGELPFLPTSYRIRSLIRNWFRDKAILIKHSISLPSFRTPRDEQGFLREIRHFYNGAAGGGNPMGSKIHVSHLFKEGGGPWEMLIWGWIPSQTIQTGAGTVTVQGEKVIDLLEKELGSGLATIFPKVKKISSGFFRKGADTSEKFLRQLLS